MFNVNIQKEPNHFTTLLQIFTSLSIIDRPYIIIIHMRRTTIEIMHKKEPLESTNLLNYNIPCLNLYSLHAIQQNMALGISKLPEEEMVMQCSPNVCL